MPQESKSLSFWNIIAIAVLIGIILLFVNSYREQEKFDKTLKDAEEVRRALEKTP